MNATVTPDPSIPSERAVLAVGSLESAWMALSACGSSAGALGEDEHVPGTGVRPGVVLGPAAVEAASNGLAS
jgi:hypothetical protein